MRIKNPNGYDNKGRDTAAHEEGHVRINSRRWEQLRYAINSMEGCYCTKECAEIAKEIAEQIAIVIFSYQRMDNIAYDWESYSDRIIQGGRLNQVRNTFLSAEKTAQFANAKLDALEKQWKSKNCKKK